MGLGQGGAKDAGTARDVGVNASGGEADATPHSCGEPSFEMWTLRGQAENTQKGGD